jgi:hypothetical protein
LTRANAFGDVCLRQAEVFAPPPQARSERQLRFDEPPLLVGQLQEIGGVADLPSRPLQPSPLILIARPVSFVFVKRWYSTETANGRRTWSLFRRVENPPAVQPAVPWRDLHPTVLSRDLARIHDARFIARARQL